MEGLMGLLFGCCKNVNIIQWKWTTALNTTSTAQSMPTSQPSAIWFWHLWKPRRLWLAYLPHSINLASQVENQAFDWLQTSWRLLWSKTGL